MNIALTRRFGEIVPHIVTTVEIINTLTNRGETVLALWDTGATCSAIDEVIINKLSLPVSDLTKVMGINSTANSYRVIADLKLHEGATPIRVNPTAVREIDQELDVHFLIGMDLISKGCFAISNQNGTVFSFAIPPIGEIDFAQQIRDFKRKNP